MNIELSVIIVNYNGVKYLKDCLDSLYLKLTNISFEIIILDNNSTDNSCVYIKENFPTVKLVESKINHGFGKGNNEAVKHAKGKYLLLFNNDTILLDNLLPALEFLENDSKIGVIGINMLNGKKEYLQAAGNFPNFKNMFQFQKLLDLGIEFKKGKFTKKYYEVDWLVGSFLMLTKETYLLIKGFDEDYFMYVEDVDLCKKIADVGLKRIFLPNLSYIHYVGFNKKKNPLLVKGYKIYLKKHFKGISVFFISLALTINSFVKFLKSRF
ncbi:glycosyltransferase family 2 protein [Flavobacterium lacisediminis]|uniref:Glycosyltransferase family 2 protein n=1 Tax=Flavobacterium lacisediminis TaxID=2989705 RepID=A0ABT3EFK1_9FLAO|nr:glycosyltransferase family 2 protein [Flavobacterium lacisediminis]MCW1146900.1 glycosyltransferase family 2 protein [Flavobacterium lacisediminis]